MRSNTIENSQVPSFANTGGFNYTNFSDNGTANTDQVGWKMNDAPTSDNLIHTISEQYTSTRMNERTMKNYVREKASTRNLKVPFTRKPKTSKCNSQESGDPTTTWNQCGSSSGYQKRNIECVEKGDSFDEVHYKKRSNHAPENNKKKTKEFKNFREKVRSARITKQINELNSLLAIAGIRVPKGTKGSVLRETANYIRLLQQHQ